MNFPFADYAQPANDYYNHIMSADCAIPVDYRPESVYNVLGERM